MNFQAGDRALIKRRKGFARYISELICWWTNSKFSHIEPILDSAGNSIDVTVPTIKKSNIRKYLNGDYRVVVIRPVQPIPDLGAWIMAGHDVLGVRYDLLSYIGYLINKPIQGRKTFNCSEATFYMDQKAGLFKAAQNLFISPQTYADFTVAGMFTVIYEMQGG